MSYIVVKHSETFPTQTAFLDITGMYSHERSKAKEYPTIIKARNAARIFDGLTSPAHCYPLSKA